MKKPFYFGSVGDVHGEMNRMVGLLAAAETKLGVRLEFVLQVGDFEPHRSESDLRTMAAPSKYRHLGDFHQFHLGFQRFPWTVFFIGGNHEPYGYLDQFPGGVELLPECRYLGRSGCLKINGLSVAGLSGIYHSENYKQPRPPVERIGEISNKHFIYFNEGDVERLLDLKEGIDVLLLHEWPSNIIEEKDQEEFENTRRSLKYDFVGNEISETVVQWLNPKLVLCGHMHKKYRRVLSSSNKQPISVCCLASIHEGIDSVAVFRVKETGEIAEVA